MSNPLAIAAVTATLSQYLSGVAADPTLAGTVVTVHPPDRARVAGTTGRQLNLFLYQVTPNAGWRNMDLRIRDDSGSLVNQPVLALDLHYLLTAYGQNDDELDAHHLIAYAMSLIHDRSVITPAQIRAAIAAQPEVADSDLADQFEMIKLCPHVLTEDELFKLWSAFQIHYRLSVAYEASVVLIERPVPTRVALPVLKPQVFALPMHRPVINAVSPSILPPGGTLAIQGYNLKGDTGTAVEVHFSETVVPVSPTVDTELTVTLPANLQAGINTVQVVQQLNFGTAQAPDPHRGFASNLLPFILTPLITTPEPINATRGGTLTLTVTPPIGRLQAVMLLLSDQALAIPARPTTGPATITTLDFPIPATFPAGTYLLRVQVDGAASQLTVDPTSNQFTGPTVTVA